jgi:hypothetical protein
VLIRAKSAYGVSRVYESHDRMQRGGITDTSR